MGHSLGEMFITRRVLWAILWEKGEYEAHRLLLVWWEEVYHPVYASLPPWVGVPHPVPPCVPCGDRSVHEGRSGRLCTSCSHIKERRVCAEVSRLSPPENKPPGERKPCYKRKETRYRKHLRTRTTGMLRGVKRVSPTPFKARACPFTTLRTVLPPRSRRAISD